MLVTEQTDARRSELLAYAREQGIGEINIPRKIVCVERLPLLGTGKTDYPGIQQLAREALA